MANKLKIFEKLGLIEKKESEELDATALNEASTEGTQETSIEEPANEPNELPAIDHIEPLNTPILSSDPILKENLPTIEPTEPIITSEPTFTPTPSKDAGIIEDVEKKLDAMIESYERNKLLSIEDIYRKSSLITEVKSTIFMVDVYGKALPENLPLDIKRDSVLNIMKASDIRIDDLLSDAYKRIDALNNVLENVVQSTDELKAKNTATIKDLEKRIDELKRNIVEREKFQETQNTMIEYEIQRIINIVDFVKPK